MDKRSKNNTVLIKRVYQYPSNMKSRVLYIGNVPCSIYGKNAQTLPGKSLQCASRSYLRMRNLYIERPGMYGPLDYFGDLREGLVQMPATMINPGLSKTRVKPEKTLTTAFNWISNVKKSSKFSLFANPGKLQLCVDLSSLEISYNVDLSDFNARLVDNRDAFYIAAPSKKNDEFRVVSYEFQHGYSKNSGEFLEFHEFSQFITPMWNATQELSDKGFGGYVLLARIINNQMELIKVGIRFGQTLIIDANCIHGDASLQGRYMMAMTSDHYIMSGANTAFIENCSSCQSAVEHKFNAPQNPASGIRKLIFNPLSFSYWKKLRYQ